MISIKYQVLSIKVLLVLLLNTYYLLPTTIIAAESTPSSEIRTKLEELKREIASKAAKLKQEISKKLNNKAYVGNIKTHTSSSLTLASNTTPKLVSINQDTIFESKQSLPSKDGKVKGRKFSQKTLTEEDYLAALGDVDETGVLTAKKIVLLPTPNYKLKTYLWGKIVSKEARLVTLLGRDLKNVAVSISKDANVKVGDFVIATGEKNDIFEADFVYAIPQGGIIKPTKR